MPTDCRIKHTGKVFRDPIHKLIRIAPEDEFILDLIDTPEFQRLRRIRQLGVSSLTYHGAEHSRFVHSLGVFNFAQRILDVLQRRYEGDNVGDYLEQHARIVKAAALLHDIGHGPFSHMIERAFKKHVNHESRTVELIADPAGDIHKILSDHKIDPKAVADLISHTSPDTLLIDVVSSQLDADRMDYLLRDSYCTGVQYGLYDAEWILNALCVGRDHTITSESPMLGLRLCLDSRRAVRTVEQFILARSHMNEQVYFQRVTRGFEAMLLTLFELAAASASRGELPDGTPDAVRTFFKDGGKLDRTLWLRFDEASMTTAFHAWASAPLIDPKIKRLAAAFLNRDRLFACVNVGKLAPFKMAEFLEQLADAGLAKNVDWRTDDIDSAVYKGIAYAAKKPKGDDTETAVESILLASGSPKDRAVPIETRSDMMQYLDEQRQSVQRVYIDKSAISASVRSLLGTFKLTIESDGGSP